LNTFKSAERSRFDAAHELAHLVLHIHGMTSGGRDIEREADMFASAFLINRGDLIGHLGRVNSWLGWYQPKSGGASRCRLWHARRSTPV
jgi:Zn-dependent peptidase ImmA (M78 family)